MPRIFRHYVPYYLLALLAMEGWIVFASTFAILHMPRIGPFAIYPGPGPLVLRALVLSLLVLIMLHLWELYDLGRVHAPRELLLRLFLAFSSAYLLMAALSYLAPGLSLGRRAYALSFVLSFALVLSIRLLYRQLIQNPRSQRRLLLLGAGRPAQIIADAVNGSHPDYKLLGSVNGLHEGVDEPVNGTKILGVVDELGRISRATRPDVIVVALTERRRSLPLPAVLECKLQGIDVEDWPDFYEKLTGKILLTDLRPSWLIFSDGFRTSHATLRAKRAIDSLLAGLGLLLTLPLSLLIAVLVKLDSPGPSLFRQERLGQGGKRFRLMKFRSMRHDAERETGPVWAGEHDPRVTRVGRLLRRSRLDELPQFFNVLKGEMSLVGPRPERPAFVHELQEKIPFYVHRLVVKPGITGWAQVKYPYGSSVEDALEKLQYDLYYIKNLTIFLDLLILLHTLQVVLFGKGSR